MSEPEELLNRAADASTPLEELAELAYRHPQTRAAVAGNPSAYPDLLTWLASLGDPDVDEVLAARSNVPTRAEAAVVAEPSTPEDQPLVAEPDSRGSRPPARLAALVRKPAVIIGIAAVVVVIAVAGVAIAVASTRQSPVDASHADHASSSGQERSSSTPEPLPAPTSLATIAITTNQGLIRDDDLYSIGPLSAVVWSPTPESSNGEATVGSRLAFKTMLIDPTVAVAATQASWDAPAGQVFGVPAIAAQLDSASPSGFAAVAAVTIPSSGLQASSTSYSLATWSANSSTPTLTKLIAPACPETCGLDRAWYSGATIVVQWNKDGYNIPLITQGVDAATGKTIWTSTAVVQDAVGSTLIVDDANKSLAGITLSSGVTAWTFAHPGDIPGANYLGYLGGQYIHGDWASSDGGTHEFVLDATSGRTVLDRLGSPPNSCLCDHFSNMVYDPSSDMVIAEAEPPSDVQGGFDIEVVKASDGTAVYTLDSDGLAALGTPPLVAATGGAAWIQKSGQWDLFVETTGKEDPRSQTVAALPFVPDVTNGSLTVLDRSIAGPSLIVAHQGQEMTPDLLAQATASLN